MWVVSRIPPALQGSFGRLGAFPQTANLEVRLGERAIRRQNTKAARLSAKITSSAPPSPPLASPTMASAELIVAKTALSGALFRPDPRPCSRDDIESMLALVNSTIAECSPPNVQV